jgi:site-specific recombinase XerD
MGTMLFSQPIAEFLAALELERGCSKRTVNGYRLDLQQFVRYLAEHHLEGSVPRDVERGHIRMFLAYLSGERGNSARTCCRRLAAVSSFYKFLLIDGVQTA